MRRNFLKVLLAAFAMPAASTSAQEKKRMDRLRITGPLTIRVDAVNGDDNSGGMLQGTPFKTIMAAIRFVQADVDCRAWPVTIKCADSSVSYDAFQCYNPLVGYNQIFVTGNETTPASCKIEIAAGACVAARDGGIVTVKGFKFNATTTGCNALDASQFGVIDFAHCEFGSFVGGHHISATELGSANCLGDYTVSGSAAAHLYAAERGHIKVGVPAVSVPNALSFSEAWANSVDGCISYAGHGTFSGAGASTGTIGQTYAATMNGTINFCGTTPPGNIPGATASGGQVKG